jgi:hypothetical protein
MSQLGDLSTEQLRTVMVALLQTHDSGQLNPLRHLVPKKAIEMGLLNDFSLGQAGLPNASVFYGQRTVQLSDGEILRLNDVIWDLIIEGIVRPGIDGMNSELPFYHITPWGKVALKEGPRTPYDPDGYLKRLQNEIQGLDPIIIIYLNESLHTLRVGCLLSSTIALGCAAEKALVLLIAAYGDSLPQAMQTKFKQNTENKMIKRQFDEFRKMIESELRARLPQELSDGLDVELNGMFDFIRIQRNDAGHPTGKTVERDTAYANLILFPVHLRKVYALLAWVKANPRP